MTIYLPLVDEIVILTSFYLPPKLFFLFWAVFHTFLCFQKYAEYHSSSSFLWGPLCCKPLFAFFLNNNRHLFVSSFHFSYVLSFTSSCCMVLSSLWFAHLCQTCLNEKQYIFYYLSFLIPFSPGLFHVCQTMFKGLHLPHGYGRLSFSSLVQSSLWCSICLCRDCVCLSCPSSLVTNTLPTVLELPAKHKGTQTPQPCPPSDSEIQYFWVCYSGV